MIRKIFKILLISVGSLLMLIIVILALAGSGVFNSYIARFVQVKASENINGKLTIGSLEGKIFSGIQLRNVLVTMEEDTVLFLESADINYSLKGLLKRTITIDRIFLNEFDLYLNQNSDSIWNFTRLMKEPDEKDQAGGEFNWRINLDEFILENLNARILSVSEDDMIPGSVSMTMMLSGWMYADTLNVDLDSMSLHTRSPDLVLNNMQGRFIKKGSGLQWENLTLRFINTVINSGGIYNPDDNGYTSLYLESEPFDHQDFHGYIPELDIKGKPRISVQVKGDENEYVANGTVAMNDQYFDLSGRLTDLAGEPEYYARLGVQGLDASEWTGKDNLKTSISGEITFSGRSFDITENQLDLKGHFTSLEYGDYFLESASISMQKRKDRISGVLNAGLAGGTADIGYELSSVFDIPVFELSLDYQNIDIGALPGPDTLSSDLNGSLVVQGRGNSAENLTGEMELISAESVIAGRQLGEFSASIVFIRGNYEFEIRELGAPYFVLNLRGNGDIEDENDIDFSLFPLDIDPLLTSFGLPTFSFSGEISGNVSGTPDSLSVSARAEINEFVFDTVSIGSLNAETRILLSGETYSGEADIISTGIQTGAYQVNRAEISGEFSENYLNTIITVAAGDSLEVFLNTVVTGFDNPLINIRDMALSFYDQEWSVLHDSAYVSLNENSFLVSDFEFGSGDQLIRIDGLFSFEGEEDLIVEMSGIDLGALPLPPAYKTDGTISSAIRVSGNAGNPEITATLNTMELSVNQYEIDSVNMSLSYADETMELRGDVFSGEIGEVKLSADIPVRIAFNDSISLLGDNRGLRIEAGLDSLDLSKVFSLFPVEGFNLSGFADVDASVSNSISDPVISGVVNLYDAGLENSEYGIEYEDINMFASIDSSTFALDSLSVSSGKGSLGVKGFVSLENTDSIGLNDFEMILRSSGFQAVGSSGIELNFDSDITISGLLGEPFFKGGLDINSSRINVDYFTQTLSEKRDEPDPPLLSIELSDTLVAVSDTVSKWQGISGSEFYSDIRGELEIDIPGNTWVTGKDMNFELEGSLRAVKKTEDISLFGDLNIRRGYYKLYGRNFDINRGVISFTGASGFNPELDFEISYRFRDVEKELRDLVLNVSGKLRQPEFNFMLDDQVLEEKDAISYIIFGKSVNQLGEGERESISGEEMALGAAVTQLSSVIKDVLQESAGIDVFEISGGEDWKSGNVTIGKYITRNLFLSYERSFDFDKQTKTADTERIILEYQLVRNIILKATNQDINSGFDLIFRKTWK